MGEKPVSKERIKLEKDLLFYLRYYKELQDRGHYKQELDYQIELLTKKVKGNVSCQPPPLKDREAK